MAEFHSFIQLSNMFFIHLSIDEQLCYFHILPIVNSAAMNIGVHVSFRISVFDLDIHLRVKLLDHGSSIFSFLRNPCIAFPSGCTNLPSHQLCMRVPFSPHPHQPIFVMCRLFDASYSDRYEVLIVVFICISLMINAVEKLSTCLVVICFSSLEKCLCRCFAYFLIGLFSFFYTEFI